MTTSTNPALIAGTSASAEVKRAALLALALGSVLIYTVGFAHSSHIHNAAHDTRHALSFPCH